MLLQSELERFFVDGMIPPQKGKDLRRSAMDHYRQAIVEVARLCNHQKQQTPKSVSNIKALKEKISEKVAECALSENETNKEKLAKMRSRLKSIQETKDVNLQTSKMNYLDPRITLTFARRTGTPLEAFYSRTLLKRFRWAVVEIYGDPDKSETESESDSDSMGSCGDLRGSGQVRNRIGVGFGFRIQVDD